MDALALLCNLYGDGPATLRRLRESGCATFASLERISADELAEILASTPVAARRFQREAKLLVERISEAEFDDPNAPGEGAQEIELESTHTLTPAPRDPSSAPRAVSMDRALAAWRDMDARDAAQPPASASAPELEPDPRDTRARRVDEHGEVGLPLRPELFDGLDAELCARLRELGIETAEDLIACDPLELHRTVSVALTRLMRFQSLARRHLGFDSNASARGEAQRRELRFSPDPRAALESAALDTQSEPSSGPFA